MYLWLRRTFVKEIFFRKNFAHLKEMYENAKHGETESHNTLTKLLVEEAEMQLEKEKNNISSKKIYSEEDLEEE